MSPIKPKYYECGICECIHPWDFHGDCRDDNNRFAQDELDERHDPYGWELLSWEERLLADGARLNKEQ